MAASTTTSSFNPVPGSPRIAVLIPCYNEAIAIRKVICDFREQLPAAAIYVYDNNSSDGTAEIAAEEGAVVRREKRQGKGHVLASMFRDVDADVYVLVDGDDTYPAESVHRLIQPVLEDKADMVVGTRLGQYGDGSFRPFHVVGNYLVVRLVNLLFNNRLTDIMSGYRAFNRDLVKTIPLISKGFEVETQMTLQALQYDFVVSEVPVRYGARPEGSHSKLRTFSDGAKVLLKVFDLFKAYRPLLFFSLLGMLMGIFALLVGGLPVVEFIQTGKISRLPSAVLASGLAVLGALSVATGLSLDAINHRWRELMWMVAAASRRERDAPSYCNDVGRGLTPPPARVPAHPSVEAPGEAGPDLFPSAALSAVVGLPETEVDLVSQYCSN
jgi:glycosyltransferase involved in cell wall biosynthesis